MIMLKRLLYDEKTMSAREIDQAKKDFLPPPGWKRNPILLQLKKLDEALTYRLALAFNKDCPLGHLQARLCYFEYTSHTIVCFSVAIFFWWMSISMTSKALFTNIILAMVVDAFVVAVIKSACRRRKPGVTREQYEANPSSANLSFPSGFVSRSTVILMILLSHNFFVLIPLMFFKWSILMLVTKVFLGRFFIFDAVAGVPVGLAVHKFIQLVWLDPDDVRSLEAFFAGQIGDD